MTEREPPVVEKNYGGVIWDKVEYYRGVNSYQYRFEFHSLGERDEPLQMTLRPGYVNSTTVVPFAFFAPPDGSSTIVVPLVDDPVADGLVVHGQPVSFSQLPLDRFVRVGTRILRMSHHEDEVIDLDVMYQRRPSQPGKAGFLLHRVAFPPPEYNIGQWVERLVGEVADPQDLVDEMHTLVERLEFYHAISSADHEEVRELLRLMNKR